MESQQQLIETWLDHLRNQEASKLNITGYCKANSLAVHKFHYWKRKLGSSGRSGFIELPRFSSQANENILEIKLGQNFELHINLKIPGNLPGFLR